ncbi:MAG: prepilin-type N-terminal cleavage/methylation domain-containing protein [Candidatus Gracilibacteria bacterium]|nr:prepilin-type N-terminal cleavage/methylation domain-containing protein [Candidatus Gracilibacteria bacterium]
MKTLNKKGFTLVELVVVITIIAILSTIAFVGYQQYFGNSRDSNRVQTMQNIETGLQLAYSKTRKYPIPEENISISVSGTITGYQGYFGDNGSKTILMNTTPLDPLDNVRYTYSTNAKYKKYQLLTFLEGDSQTAYNPIINQTYALDYTDRIPQEYGSSLGILLDTNNNPVQSLGSSIDLLLGQAGTQYKAVISNSTTITGSGVNLGGAILTLSQSSSFAAPITCPTGFIPVPGNETFMQPGFCVMKYEAGSPTQSDATWAGLPYASLTSLPQSIGGNYPIITLTQAQAITACQSIGVGYHLITNNEWMTIARNIESQKDNWSGGAVGSGGVYRGITNETTSATSLGCPTSSSTFKVSTKYAAGTSSMDTTLWGASKGSDCDSKRQLKLSNGEVIWDLSGNVQEHVNKFNVIDGTNYNSGQTVIAGSSAGTAWDGDGIYTTSDMLKYGSISSLGIANGMGNVNYANGVASNIFIRGGNALSTTNAGIYTIDLIGNSTTSANTTGFRCAK